MLAFAATPLHWHWLQNFLVKKLTLSILQFFLACLASLELASISHRGQLRGVWREYFGESPARDLDEAFTLSLNTERALLSPGASRRQVDLSYLTISTDRAVQCTSALAFVY